MRKSRMFYIFCFVFGLIVLVFAWSYWHSTGLEKSSWAIELVGGAGFLGDEIVRPEGEDVLYMQTLSLQPSQEVRDRAMAIDVCYDTTEECVTKNLSRANFLLIHKADVQPASDLVEYYSNNEKIFVGVCPAKLEISEIIRRMSIIKNRPPDEAQQIAKEAVEKIQKTGGLTRSVDTDLCKEYFFEKPYLARGYLAHLALLISFEQGKYSPAWIHLMALPGVVETIK